MNYIIGMDVGTTATKGVLYDENGSQILLCTGATAHYLQKKLPIELHTIRTGAFDVIQAIYN